MLIQALEQAIDQAAIYFVVGKQDADVQYQVAGVVQVVLEGFVLAVVLVDQFQQVSFVFFLLGFGGYQQADDAIDAFVQDQDHGDPGFFQGQVGAEHDGVHGVFGDFLTGKVLQFCFVQIGLKILCFLVHC